MKLKLLKVNAAVRFNKMCRIKQVKPNYRVSIKSFPGYKHLLQENYVEYKHMFLPLLKLVSKILCHVFIVILCAQGVGVEA
jgi:hypothetical protein